MRISIIIKHNNGINSLQAIRYKHLSIDRKLRMSGVLEKGLGGFFADEYYQARCRFHAFKVHFTVVVRNFTFVAFMFLIDT